MTIQSAADVVAADEGGRLSTAERITALYRQHMPAATRLAYLLTGNHALAEDVAQDAFLRASGRLFALRDETAFGAYLNRAVVNTARNNARRRRLERSHLTREQTRVSDRLDPPDIETRGVMWAALLTLPERQRAALVLRFYLDLSEAHTAELLRCRPGTVKSAVSRGLAALRAAAPDLAAPEITEGRS